MMSYHLGTVNDFHWGLKPVSNYSTPHTFPTFIGEDKEKKHLLSLPGHLYKYEQNDRKVKGSVSKKEGRKTRTQSLLMCAINTDNCPTNILLFSPCNAI